jgi:hypothetical protein
MYSIYIKQWKPSTKYHTVRVAPNSNQKVGEGARETVLNGGISVRSNAILQRRQCYSSCCKIFSWQEYTIKSGISDESQSNWN